MRPAAPTIPVMRPQLPGADRLLPYLRRIDMTRFYSNHGPLSGELEARLAELFGMAPGGVVCASSGTAALVGAILAAAGRAGPQRPLALIPAFTFIATAAAVEACGYRPYLADVDGDSWTLAPQRLLGHPERDRIGLVVAVAPFGRPLPQAPWLRFREASGIPVAIDAAAGFAGVARAPQACLGAVPVALSFHATKPFATGEGGAVLVGDVALAQDVARALNFGVYQTRDCRTAGSNGKMSEYHAAVGLAELDGWDAKAAQYAAVAAAYHRHAAAAGLSGRLHATPEIAPVYALFGCRDAAEGRRVAASLRRHRVDFRLWYGKGLHHQTYYADLPRDDLPVTDDLAPRLLGLPTAPDLEDAMVARIVQAAGAGCRDAD
jgi:dTDP-4-amino-4,6-dideoxygalactose transaminase